MARTEITLNEDATLVITRDEQGPEAIYKQLATAQTALIVTYNLPKPGGPLLVALERATQLQSLRLVTNIPSWWASYWDKSTRQKARKAIASSIARLEALVVRPGVEIYFTRKNHAKIYVLDDIGYVGSSNFSDESADNIEAGVIINDQEALEQLRKAAWDLLKPDLQLHPTLATAVAASLEDWLRGDLQFDTIYSSVNSSDPEHAQNEFRNAVHGLLELARRAEAVLDDVRDPEWAEPLQAVIRDATSLHEISTVIGSLEYSYGKIQACIAFSLDDAIERHVAANCSDEETLEWCLDDGRQAAEERWEEIRGDALRDLRRVVDVLEGVKDRIVTNLHALQKPVDNTSE